VSFSIEKGELYGLLGPNGAGKTTTISIMSSLLKQDEGEVLLNGFDTQKDSQKVKNIIGVVPQEIALYKDLSAYDNLLFWGGLYLNSSASKWNVKEKANETLQLLGLYDRRNDKIKNYSGGMKRRINIAAAILHSPEIIFMDEPTVGIDPQSRNLIYEVIEKLNAQGITIVYTTHYMEEVERFCKRIGIIDNGKIIAQGTLDELKSSSKMRETIVVSSDNLTDDIFKRLSSSWKEVKRAGMSVHFYSSSVKNDLSKIILMCSEAGLEVSNIDIQKVNLESIFLSLTGKELRD
ncbi:MAG TPA: ABC transporter ATP-binding protein, partial [Bacteroidia bacterium]